MSRQASLDRIFDEQLESLAVALRPSTIAYYRSAVHRFLRYLRTTPNCTAPPNCAAIPTSLAGLRPAAGLA